MCVNDATVKILSSLEEIIAALPGLGYSNAIIQDGVGFISIRKNEKNFNAVLMIEETPTGKERLVTTCQIALRGDFSSANWLPLCEALQDMNTRIHPFATGTLTGADNPELENKEEESPVVLISSIAIGDLSPEELGQQMEDLRIALTSVIKVLDLYT